MSTNSTPLARFRSRGPLPDATPHPVTRSRGAPVISFGTVRPLRTAWVLVAVLVAPFSAGPESNPGPRSGHSFVYDRENSRALLLFGYFGKDLPAQPEIWSWDGARWSVIDRTGPGFRTMAGVAVDDAGGKLMLFGGAGPAYQTRFGDTWTWSQGRWTQLVLSGPGPTDHHAVVYDSARRSLLSFGGNDPSGGWRAETWLLDSTGWRRAADAATSPPPRAHHAMVYDDRRGRVVLFGGLASDRSYLNDTWEWDGVRWVQMKITSPPPVRTRHRMAFDSARGVTVLYGGAGERPAGQTTGFVGLSDLWEYDGRAWRPAVTSTGPGQRFMHAMTFDEARGEILLFGGEDGTSNFNDLWAWKGRAWVKKGPR